MTQAKPTIERNDDRHGTIRSGPLIAIVVTAFVLPILYVLSIGPVALMFERFGWDTETARMIYYPVIWLHDNTFLKEPLEWYVELFGVK